MLTRLKVSGFKNLVDVDVRFGPFTCIVGPNGVGKSNLFDAIRFLSALADRPLMDASSTVRDESGRSLDVRALFHRIGSTFDPDMRFEAEMIVPPRGNDDLWQEAEASITFLRYALQLSMRTDHDERTPSILKIVKEELTHIKVGEAKQNLPFPHDNAWRASVIKGRRSGTAFLSTDSQGRIQVHQDGAAGAPRQFLADSLPRTLLSVANASESPTILLARREMQSWRLLQLEPSALRHPDDFTATPRIGEDGAHLTAALYRLARQYPETASKVNPLYAKVSARLAELIHDVQTVSVDRDEHRELLTLMATLQDGTTYPAKALSDGTLRFLALAVLALDPQTSGVLCLEEPENGIHPARIPAMLQLVQDIATDPEREVDETNPLRQVIINTHSPTVIQQVPDSALLIAEQKETVRGRIRFLRANFGYLPETWREEAAKASGEALNTIQKADLLSYLSPIKVPEMGAPAAKPLTTRARPRRVIEREDMQPQLPGFGAADSNAGE